MKWVVRPSKIEAGDAVVPGDKSISHRALMLSSLAEGRSRITNLAPGADVRSTRTCLQHLGCDIRDEDFSVAVNGGTLRAPTSTLDAGNSGTTMRLLSGILAGKPFTSRLTGDESLRTRPMRRIAEPLEQMGAHISTEHGHAPVQIEGGRLQAIQFEPRVPSAQVKSCVLLAALFAEGETSIIETVKTRDHTERMFLSAGIPIVVEGLTVRVTGLSKPSPMDIDVPGDFSSASFLLTAAAIAGDIIVRKVGVNPTRTAFLRVLERMGCSVQVVNEAECAGEPAGDIVVRASDLTGVAIDAAESAEILDEMPLIALLAALAHGETRVTGAAELRVKESDRIVTIVGELATLGADIHELPDGFAVQGKGRDGLVGAHVESHHDHRIAMMLAIAGLVAKGKTVIDGVESARISYPGFTETMRSLGASIDES